MLVKNQQNLDKLSKDSIISKLAIVRDDIIERRDRPMLGGVYLYRGSPVVVIRLFDFTTLSGDYSGTGAVNAEIARLPIENEPKSGEIRLHETTLIDTKDLEEYINVPNKI